MSEGAYPFPETCHYDREHHTWARRDRQDGRVVVGIDALGLASLGELAYLSLHGTGSRVRRGEPLGTLEAAKMTGELIAPVSGTIVERNERALADPLLVNGDPYGDGWLAVLEPDNWDRDAAELVGGPALADWVAGEVERYRAQGWIE